VFSKKATNANAMDTCPTGKRLPEGASCGFLQSVLPNDALNDA
jgi:hypothetical protein